MQVQIPTPLFSYTGNRSLVEAHGSTLNAVTVDLDRQFPGLRFRIIDEQDNVRPHVKIFVNRATVKSLATVLKPTDEVAIVQAFSGG